GELVKAQTFPDALHDLIMRRAAQAIDYQNAKLARRFLSLVARAAAQDSAAKDWALTRAVADGWFKLLTYKDEYEVARLHAGTDYDGTAREPGIEGGYWSRYHLHPHLLRRLGRKHKLAMRKPFALLFDVLRRMKRLRGTPFDPFGW